MGVFTACCGCGKRNEDSQPYEAPRCAQSPSSPVNSAVNASPPQITVGNQERGNAENLDPRVDEARNETETEHISSARVSCIPSAVGSTGQIFSLIEAHSFNPPLCSTKIGEATPVKSMSLSAIETNEKQQNKSDDVHSLLLAEKCKSKMKSRPLRRMTVSSPFSESAVSEFDDTKMVLPQYHPLFETSPKGTVKDENEKKTDGSTSTGIGTSPGRTFVIRVDADAYNEAVFLDQNTAPGTEQENMAKQAVDEVDVEMPPSDDDCKDGSVGPLLSMTAKQLAASMEISGELPADKLNAPTKPLNPDESAELPVPPPNTPVCTEMAMTSETVTIRGSSAYFTAF
ncbi:unnamed protein product [Cylicocyclus nassatus]|uniref:Uncharacterized protein n=1 Tax=Cylicocyclus nassatus TaxID=53992 RepID=A0AA36GLG5_CYLNA|nr:unnamed protein product [Cylicocyclus nassatus]